MIPSSNANVSTTPNCSGSTPKLVDQWAEQRHADQQRRHSLQETAQHQQRQRRPAPARPICPASAWRCQCARCTATWSEVSTKPMTVPMPVRYITSAVIRAVSRSARRNRSKVTSRYSSAQQQRVADRDDARLGGRHQAGDHAAQNHHRCQQRRQARQHASRQHVAAACAPAADSSRNPRRPSTMLLAIRMVASTTPGMMPAANICATDTFISTA